MSTYLPQPREGRGVGFFGVPEELNSAVADRLRNALPALGAVYLAVAVFALFTTDAAGRVRDGQTAFLAGICAFGVWFFLRIGRIAVEHMHFVASGICGMALVQGLASLQFSESTAAGWFGPATVVFLIIAASSALHYSLRWHGAVTLVCLAGWFITVQPKLTGPSLLYWTLVLVTTALLSGLSLQYRIWKFWKRKTSGSNGRADDPFGREHLQMAVEGTQDGLWHWELQSDVFHFSPAWARMMGFDPAELTAHPDEWLNRVHPGYLARLKTELAAHLYGDAPQFRNEHRIRRKDGVYIWVLARATVRRNEAGEPMVLAGSHSDITPLIEAEKRLLTDTFSDHLTGLPNRAFLMSHLERAVEEKNWRGQAAQMFAVLFLDLDRFKFINDTMGHETGDQLLKAVAARLKNCARPDDIVARFGGDEFVLLLQKVRDPEEAMHVGRRIVRALATPFQLGDRTVQSGGSVGIALSREEFGNAEEILKFGDIAMYQAKSLRNGEVQLFHRGMLENSNALGVMKSDLENALKQGQMVLHYQPFIHTATGSIVGAEALIRWQRTPEELLYPVDFLPLAEKSGLMHDIGEWALRTACAQNSEWQREGLSPVRMAVNLSASQLQQKDFPQIVQRVLRETKLKPEWLELELTEATLTRSMDVAPAILKSLNESGIRASIDDFGSGNASLNFLRQFQFHTMKMDRSYVTDVTKDPKAANAARGMITLAHSLDLSVVAECVEQQDQFRFLSAERCDHVQGYLTGRPVPSEEMLTLLRSGRNCVAPSPGLVLGTDLTRLNALHATASAGAPGWASGSNALR